MVERKRTGRKLLVASIGVAAVSYVACGGSTIGDSDHSGVGGSGNAGGGFGTAGNVLVANLALPVDPCSPPIVGQSTPLELTNSEYDRTVRDLLGDTSAPSKEFPDDTTDIGFRRDPTDADPTRLAHYVKAAGEVADAAVGRLDMILPCSPAIAGEEACAAQFIATFGKRAFRHSLTTDEFVSLHQAYVDGRTNGDFASGIRAVIFAALASPHFYQVEEKGASSTPALLGPYALSSRLSYFIYRSMPDDELLAAADAGQLSSHDDIAAQVLRMLQNPKAHDAVTDFFKEWLRLDGLSKMDKSAGLLANFASVRDSMVTETTAFAESIFFGSGRYADLLTSRSAWVNADVAAIYGVPFMGTGFQSVMLDNTVRSGLLTQPSILSLTSGTEQTSPTLRGKFVWENILCQPTIPPQPPGIPSTIEPVSPGVTTRQRYEKAIQGSATCAGCHRMMDSIGYGFEEFDAVGRYRSMDNGLPVDPYGEVVGIDGLGDYFSGVVELSLKISRSSAGRDCMTRQWFRFALARTETEEDACSLQAAQTAGDMPDILVAIATSTAFRYARW